MNLTSGTCATAQHEQKATALAIHRALNFIDSFLPGFVLSREMDDHDRMFQRDPTIHYP
jgi:hypothetical protein